jgi:hypothetical protein
MKAFALALLTAALAAVHPASAATIAVTTTPSSIFSNTGNFTLGWSFLVNSDISVTALGAFDANEDGFNVAHDVGLWNSSGVLLASGTVPSGTGGTLDSSYRFVPITPIGLTSGSTYYVGAVYFSSDSDGWLQDPTTLITAPEISYDSRRYTSGAILAFPTDAGSGSTGYFGGNFQFDTQAVPEPSTFGLLALGGAILAVRRRRA